MRKTVPENVAEHSYFITHVLCPVAVDVYGKTGRHLGSYELPIDP